MADFQALRAELITQTKQAVAASVDDDTLIIGAVTTLEQLEQATNSLMKKGREWYGLMNPELERQVKDHEAFLKAIEQAPPSTMGAPLAPADQEALRAYLGSVRGMYAAREQLRAYIEEKMRARCPNVHLLAGAFIGAKLLAHAGSLRRLSSVPSSTLQLFGAETALFRHLRDKRHHKPPKYGILYNHPLVQHTPQQHRGKAARTLADKLSICAKLDHFKGELTAPALKDALAAKFGAW